MKKKKTNEKNDILKMLKVVKVFIYILAIVILAGIVAANISPQNEERIEMIITSMTLFMVLLGVSSYIYKRIKDLKKSKSLLEKIVVIMILIALIITIIGAIMMTISAQNAKCGVDFVEVINVDNGKIIIDGSSYYHGDYKEVEISKPFFLKVNKGDKITIRHQETDEGLHYVWNISEDTSGTVLLVGGPLLELLVITDIILSGINYDLKIKNKGVRK